MPSNLRRLAFATLGLCLTTITLIGWQLHASLDGLAGLRCTVSNTGFATGYSDQAFRRLAPGMPEHEALQLLGAPIQGNTFPGPTTDFDSTFYYSYQAGPGPYRLRAVHLLRGSVVRVVAQCVAD